MKDSENSFNKINLRYLILGLATLALVSFGFYATFKNKSQEVLYSSYQSEVERTSTVIKNQFETVSDQIRFLSGLPPISGIYRAYYNDGVDPLDNTQIDDWNKRLQKIFVEYLKTHKHVKQLRYIGVLNGGKELVRVEYQKDGIVIVDDANLQNKSSRKYYKEAVSLPPGAVYISEIELNREHGKIEIPEWPTFRVALGVRDTNDNLFGMVIINYNAHIILDLAKNDVNTSTRFLLNKHGGYLVNPDSRKEFAFDRGEALSWQVDTGDRLPDESNSEWNTVWLDNVKYNYVSKKIELSTDVGIENIQLVTAISSKQFNRQILTSAVTLIMFLILLVGGGICTAFIQFSFSRRESVAVERVNFLKGILNGLNKPIFTLDSHGIIDFWNDSSTALFGLKEKDVKNKSFCELFLSGEQKESLLLYLSMASAEFLQEPLGLQVKTGGDAISSVNLALIRVHENELGEKKLTFVVESDS